MKPDLFRYHAITALVFITSDRHLIHIEASEGAHPSWATFLRVPGELPQQGGLWLMGAMWAGTGYGLSGWSRPSLMDLALMERGAWKPPAVQFFG